MKLFSYFFGSTQDDTARRDLNSISVAHPTSSRHPSHGHPNQQQQQQRNRPSATLHDLVVDTENDTDTLGNETLYDWSITAQTIEGAAAALTDPFDRRRPANIVTPTNLVMEVTASSSSSNHSNHIIMIHGGKKKKNPFGFGSSTKGDNASSSEDEEEDDDEEELGGNIGYCQLEDSPPRTGAVTVHHDHDSGRNSEESTPHRRTGGGFLFRNTTTTSNRDKQPTSPIKSKVEKQIKSPNKLMSRIQRKLKTSSPTKDQPYPIQQLRKPTTEPVDVDSFLPEDGIHIISPPSRLPNTIKGKIQELTFDSPPHVLSPCETAEDASTMDDSCAFSLRNIGNDNSPFVPPSSFSCPSSFNIHSACVRPINSSPPAVLNKKEMDKIDPTSLHEILNLNDIPIRNNIRMDSDFTFSLHSSDLEGSDGTELLLDGVEMEYDVDSFRKQWMLDEPPAKVDEAQEKEVGKQLRKNIKKKLLGKVKIKRASSLESITPLAGDETPVKHIFACDKSKNSNRQNLSSSAISLAPLTGLEDVRCSNIGKSQPDVDLLMEIDRRKASEKREIERRTLITRQRLEWEKLRKKRLIEAERFRAERKQSKDSATTTGINNENELLELSKNRTLLKSWMQDCSNMYLDEDGDVSKNHPYLPRAYEIQHSEIDLNRSNLSDTTPHSVVTTRVSNLWKSKLDTDDVNISFPDEDSAALTPEATAPMVQDFSCVVCKSSDRTHLAVPCMHFSYCADCVTEIECRKSRCCNVCNKEVENFSRVFF